jgi:hypothetical protein
MSCNGGTPRSASPELAKSILQRLQTNSSRYGTAIAIDDGIRVIHVSDTGTAKTSH